MQERQAERTLVYAADQDGYCWEQVTISAELSSLRQEVRAPLIPPHGANEFQHLCKRFDVI